MRRGGWVRTAARGIAGLRVALGLAALVAPRAAAGLWVGPSAGEPAGLVLGRAAGARDVALGVGALLAARDGVRAERTWVVAGACCDVLDAVTTLGHWRRLPALGRVLVTGAAVGAAVAGLATARPGPAVRP